MVIPNPQDLPERVSRLEILMELIRQKLESLENWMREIHHEMTEKFEKIDDKFDQMHQEMDYKFERVEDKFSQLRRDIDRKFTWMVGTGFLGWISLMIAIIFKH
ncbi:MAG: hypothetical protein M1421_01555 [Candidatus Eremiobacteraeota bacterium]|nr:hypothetical protein [Candidatus Eremiobacteraeota bacterium]